MFYSYGRKCYLIKLMCSGHFYLERILYFLKMLVNVITQNSFRINLRLGDNGREHQTGFLAQYKGFICKTF